MTKAKVLRQRPFFPASRKGLAIYAVVLLLFMYIFASLAINTGSLQQYFLTFLCLGLAVACTVKIFRS